MSTAIIGPFQVGDWLVEPELLRISKQGEIRKLEHRTMEILLCLVSNHGEVVSKKQLHDEVWGEIWVTDNALTRGVSKLRKSLDDAPSNPTYIDTISKSGYRLIAPVTIISDEVTDLHTESATPTPAASVANWRWLWSIAVVLVVIWISLVSTSSSDLYSEFYDPVPVSTRIGPERGLAISPDGEKISFSYSEPKANNSNVYVKLLDDLSEIKFTNLSSHQGYSFWSPDGSYMAYVSLEDGTCGIYKEPSFGGEKTRIGDCYFVPRDFVWAPDGKTIAFTDIDTTQRTRRMFFLDVATQKIEQVMSLEQGVSDRAPAFSPDGRHLIFSRNVSGRGSDLYKMQIADKTLTRLTFDNSTILGLDVFDSGRQIAFSSNRGGTYALWRVALAGGEVSRIYINDRVPGYPRFSANGKRMIYKSFRDQIRLWVMDKEGQTYTAPSPIATSTRVEMHPSLSTDGQKLVFISNRSGTFEIWSNDFSDNTFAKLTSLEGSFANMPSWSPDGSEVVFDARIDGDNTISILDVASKMVRTFVDLDADQVNARYSRDGKTIYFASNHSGSWQIWKKQVFDDNANIQQVTTSGGYHLQEGRDDEYLYYSRLDTSGIWRIANKGESAPTLFITGLRNIDWGSWVATQDGIIYLNRDAALQLYYQPYDITAPPTSILAPDKPIQQANPTLTASTDGSKIIMAQIENSEDEIMMVNFK